MHLTPPSGLHALPLFQPLEQVDRPPHPFRQIPPRRPALIGDTGALSTATTASTRKPPSGTQAPASGRSGSSDRRPGRWPAPATLRRPETTARPDTESMPRRATSRPISAYSSAGGADAEAAAHRQPGDAGARPGGNADPRPPATGRRRRPSAAECTGVGQECVGIDAGLGQPVQRQIEPAVAGILADVAGDVGQLHRHAQIDRGGEAFGIAHAHQHRHHGADRSGHAHRIGAQCRQIRVAASLGVPGKPFQQRFGQGARDGEPIDDPGEGAVGRQRRAGGLRRPGRGVRAASPGCRAPASMTSSASRQNA